MKSKILFVLIVVMGFILRSAYLGKFPIALYGDEQAFAWNAYNIMNLGQDEYGNPFPLQFRSFDDYKSPLPVYLLVPFIKTLGLNPFAIRIPIAIFSTLTILLMYKLARLFFNDKMSLLSSYLLAISPWHIHLSRGFFEATLALFFFIGGIYFFLKSSNRLSLLLTSMTFFTLSLYSYFTPRILLPLFLVLLIWFNRSVKNKNFWISFVFLMLVLLPLVRLSLFENGLERLNKLNDSTNKVIVELVNKERFASNLPEMWKRVLHNKLSVRVRLVSQNYLEHFSVNFWYIFGDSSLRYFLGNMGMFYLLEMPFFIYGLYSLYLEKKRLAIFYIIWVLVSPIPASLVGKPYALRSLSMLPPVLIFTSYGLYKFTQFIRLRNFQTLSISLLTIGYVVSVGYVTVRYYLEYPVYAATWWGWENKEAIDYAKARENKYDKIFISNFYSGITLAYAVYNQVDPLQYRNAINNQITLVDGRQFIQFGKLYFGSLDLNESRLKNMTIPPNSLYIGRPEEPEGEDRIIAPDDGRLLFVIHDTLKKDGYRKIEQNIL